MDRKAFVLGVLVFLGGCNFDYQLTGAIQDIDPALAGQWRDPSGEMSIEVRSAKDGYRIEYKDSDGTYLFDSVTLLEIDSVRLLQARFIAEVFADGTIDDTPKDHPWLVMGFERQGEIVIVRPLEADEGFMPQDFGNAAEFRSAFAAAIRRDGFFGEPVIFQKVTR